MEAVSSSMEIISAMMDEIYSDDDFNCRGRIAPIDVADLVASIAKNGLLQPILIQPWSLISGKKYRIVCGHRRFAACQRLSKTHVPAIVKEGLTELDAKTLNFVENLKRKDLNILQEARALKPYKDAKWRDEIIAAEVGMSRGWVQVRTMLLELPDDVQQVAAAGILKQEHIRQLYTVRKDEVQLYAAVRLIKDRADSGEKAKLSMFLKKPLNSYTKRERQPEEIYTMQDIIRNTIGNSLVTVAMGWCAGIVTEYEMHREIRETAALMGRTYVIPEEIKP